MPLFTRSVISEILAQFGIVLSTIVMIWLSVLLVRLLGEAAIGSIGANVIFVLALMLTITALPILLIVTLYIAVLITIVRNYRESEMVVWFASGVSLINWLRPVLQIAIPMALLIMLLSTVVSPWAHQQIGEYYERFGHRSDLSKVSVGRFIESEQGTRVLFADEPQNRNDELGKMFIRVINPEWHTVLTAEKAYVKTEKNGDRFLILDSGQGYDLKPGQLEFRVTTFDHYGMRLENKRNAQTSIRHIAEQSSKARPLSLLIADNTWQAKAQMMWRFSMPLAALNLGLLAIPLAAINPRLGKSGDLLLASLLALIYMNLITLVQAWINSGKMNFSTGLASLHALVLMLTAGLMIYRMRVKMPKAPFSTLKKERLGSPSSAF